MMSVTRPVPRIGVKICGLKHRAEVQAAALAGASYVGFVFFPKSPRSVTLPQARDLALEAPMGLAKVALVVDMDDGDLDRLVSDVPLDMLQLHGTESPDRIAALRTRFGLPIMKAVGVREATDLHRIAEYDAVADQLLIDAKPPKSADLPGGNGIGFDHNLIAGRSWAKPWMLAGGLTPGNVAQAIKMTGARQVDVSSGVESAPGQKDPELIRRFCEAAGAGAVQTN